MKRLLGLGFSLATTALLLSLPSSFAPAKQSNKATKKTSPGKHARKFTSSPLDGVYVNHGFNSRHPTNSGVDQSYTISGDSIFGRYSWKEGNKTIVWDIEGTVSRPVYENYARMLDLGNDRPKTYRSTYSLSLHAHVYERLQNGKRRLLDDKKSILFGNFDGVAFLNPDGTAILAARMPSLNRMHGIDSMGYNFFAKRQPVAAANNNPTASKKKIVVDLDRQKLFAYEGEELVYEFDCITGRAGHETTVGTFKIINKIKDYRSKKYDAPMPYSMFFSADGKAIHATPLAATRSYAMYLGIRRPGSHGCVGLSDSAAESLFDWTPTGTTVQITSD